jgi:integrase
MISESDFERLRSELLISRDALSVLLLTIMETGCRGIEAVNLRLRDYAESEVTIRHGAKRGASGSYSLTPQLALVVSEFTASLKTRSNPRLVDIHAGTRMQDASALRALRRRLAEASLLCGIEPISSLHVFRHRVAERVFKATQGNLVLVQRILRHKSIASTQHYLKSFDFKTATEALLKLNTAK